MVITLSIFYFEQYLYLSGYQNANFMWPKPHIGGTLFGGSPLLLCDNSHMWVAIHVPTIVDIKWCYVGGKFGYIQRCMLIRKIT